MVVLSKLALDQLLKPCIPPINTNHNTNISSPPIIIPTIDLNTPNAKSMLVQACKDFGFFKVKNHGVPIHIISQLEEEACNFFNLPQFVKENAGNPNPFGYGNKNIGRNGDIGWVEYLLLSASPEFISQISVAIFPHNPDFFRSAIMNYLEEVKKMTIEIMEMIEEGLNLRGEDKNKLSKLMKDEKSDSYFRLNHYPTRNNSEEEGLLEALLRGKNMVGFGEHTDPQIISVLRSNNTAGLQISLKVGSWVSVPPDRNSFFFLVGDSLQVMTNGRFKSVKHRVLADNNKSRLSMIFFAGPPLNEKIKPLPSIMEDGEESLYKEFTWLEYKKSAYQTRLSDNRLLPFLKRTHMY